jgi:hypothetical protein
MQPVGHQAVDQLADLTRNPDDQHRDAEQHRARRRIGAGMASQEGADQAVKGHR